MDGFITEGGYIREGLKPGGELKSGILQYSWLNSI